MTILRLNNTLTIPITADSTEFHADSLEITADLTTTTIDEINNFLIYPRVYKEQYRVEFYDVFESEIDSITCNATKFGRGLASVEVDTDSIELELGDKYIVNIFTLDGKEVWSGKLYVTDKDTEEIQNNKNYEELQNNIIEI